MQTPLVRHAFTRWLSSDFANRVGRRHSRDVVTHPTGKCPAISLVSKLYSSYPHIYTHYDPSSDFDALHSLKLHFTERNHAGEQILTTHRGAYMGPPQGDHFAPVLLGEQAFNGPRWSSGYIDLSVRFLGNVCA